MSLKTKALIYRYTGLYLAQKEEEAYVAKCYDNTNERTEYGSSLIRGSWQAMNGFARISSPRPFWIYTYKYKALKLPIKILHSVIIFLWTLRYDFGRILRK